MTHRVRQVAPGIAIRERIEEGEVRGAYISFWCAPCRGHGYIPINVNGHTDGWSWDEATLTLSPSVRHFTPAKDGAPEVTNCHYNVTNGRIFYHNDCADHEVRGEHAMQPFPDHYGF